MSQQHKNSICATVQPNNLYLAYHGQFRSFHPSLILYISSIPKYLYLAYCAILHTSYISLLEFVTTFFEIFILKKKHSFHAALDMSFFSTCINKVFPVKLFLLEKMISGLFQMPKHPSDWKTKFVCYNIFLAKSQQF